MGIKELGGAKVSFTISPKIEVIDCVTYQQMRVSFNKREVINNKAYLKEIAGEVEPIKLKYDRFEDLLDLIVSQISKLGLTRDELFSSNDTVEILEKLKTVNELKFLFSLPQPIWEGYTTEEHSLAVAQMLVKMAPSEKKAWLWEIAGLLHDIGKSVAAHFEKDAKEGRRQQETYNLRIADIVLRETGFTQKERWDIWELIQNSSLPYKYVAEEITSSEAMKILSNMRVVANDEENPLEVLNSLKNFWVADASDYSAVQCLIKGSRLKQSFESQFVYIFGNKDQKWKLINVELIPDLQEKYEELYEDIVLMLERQMKS